MNVLFVL